MKLRYFLLAWHSTTKMQTIWLVCMGLITILTTCKKEEILQTGPCYPLTLTTSRSSEKVFWYDADQKIIAIRYGTDTTTYTYDANGNIISAQKLILGPDYQPIGQVNIAYDYDGNNNLISVTYRANWGYNASSEAYQYNSAGQLTRSTKLNPSSCINSHFQYPNANTKNPSQSIDTIGCIPGGVIGVTINSFEYDTRHNPERSPFPTIHSDNNVTKWSYSYKNLDGGGEDLSNTTRHSYTYNSHGYPTAVTTSSLLEPIIDTRAYTYNCQ